jgi:hypothetical protein
VIALLPYLLWALLGVVVVLALGAIAVALTVLTWWAGWTARFARSHADDAPAAIEPPAPATRYLVYLSGVGDISGGWTSRYEQAFLQAIAAAVPGLAIVEDIFAYSPTEKDMASERLLGWFWRWLHAQRLRRGPLKRAGELIDIRNMLHVAVSADYRYGPIYNHGIAEKILRSLLRHGYRVGAGAPVTLLGYSGGGQVALASAGYLKAALAAPVQVISLAGLMNSNPALNWIDRLAHLYGTRDGWLRAGALIFPARWPWFKRSLWNRALAAGKIKLICTGPMVHSGRRSYLDDTARLESGQSYMAQTVDIIGGLIRSFG